jgi:two-component system, OmpR family, sensor histidine kinase ChvG
MRLPAFFVSIRARLLVVSLILLLIPVIGFRFVQEMDRYLREGQQQVLLSAARFLSASLSNRPDLVSVRDENESAAELEKRRLLSAFGNRDPELLRALGSAYRPSESIERVLSEVAKDGARIWVVDSRQVIRGLEGRLAASADAAAVDAAKGGSVTTWLRDGYRAITRPVVAQLAKPDVTITEDAAEVKRAVLAQVDRALGGQPNWAARVTPRSGIRVQSAAQPVWLGDDIVAAVVIEESDRSNRSIQATAIEALLAMTLLVVAVGFFALMAFAWRLAFRVRRLQREANMAIDNQGRIKGMISGADQRDEVGMLASTLEEVLGRLKRYNSYLEQMGGRLAHELRTPLAVVRSSLDNLSQADLRGDERVYVARAEEGIKRMSALISRMSEASQLERLLQNAERERFDIETVVRGCVEGYRSAYPNQSFELRGTGAAVPMNGVPDAIAQLLDKLVQNAIDFAKPGTPVVVALARSGRSVTLSVENQGEPIPEKILPQLFNTIVTARDESSQSDGHLGLGLRIVQLVVEIHGGTVRAVNLDGDRGARFEATFEAL